MNQLQGFEDKRLNLGPGMQSHGLKIYFGIKVEQEFDDAQAFKPICLDKNLSIKL